MQSLRHLVLCSVFLTPLISCASGPPSYEQNIYSAFSGVGNIYVRYLSDTVVLITGRVESLYTVNAIKRAALDSDKIEEVILRISIIDSLPMYEVIKIDQKKPR